MTDRLPDWLVQGLTTQVPGVILVAVATAETELVRALTPMERAEKEESASVDPVVGAVCGAAHDVNRRGRGYSNVG